MSGHSGVRVLLTADTVGGVWTFAIELARALEAMGAQVAIATMGAPLAPDQLDEAAGLELFPGQYRLEWMDDPWDDVARAGEWLLELERRFAPDVVHLNGYAHGALPFSAPVLVTGHSCVLSWWRAVKGVEAPPSWDRYRRSVADGLRGAGFVTAPSRAMLRSLEQDYGPLPPSIVIPNGRASRLFSPGQKEPFVFTAGRLWDSAKNLEAIEAVAPELPWPVYVAGSNAHPDGGARPSPLRLLGRLPAAGVAAWLGRAAVYALPARYEPFGLSALEAAYAGCALVLGDIPSLREVWGDAACYVPPDDHAALREAIADLTGDFSVRAAMAQRARTRASGFTPAAMASRYVAAYQSLLETRKGYTAGMHRAG